uniref:Uncharacterized protein n=1 Tax=Leptospirillum ferriphilum TaxID=178606 RepID=A0A7C3LTG4_9BACT
MGNRKNAIALVVLLLGVTIPLSYYFSARMSAHSKLPPANLSELLPGELVVISKATYGCPSLENMTVLRGDAVAHDEIGFANHFASAHCQKFPAGPRTFRILKLSDGAGGIRYVEVNDPQSGAAIWLFGEAPTFSLARNP